MSFRYHQLIIVHTMSQTTVLTDSYRPGTREGAAAVLLKIQGPTTHPNDPREGNNRGWGQRPGPTLPAFCQPPAGRMVGLVICRANVVMMVGY